MATVTQRRIIFREMHEIDLEQVLKIEFRSYVFPWTLGIFQNCLRSGYDCRVMSRDGIIVGHSVLTAAAGEAHLLNVCVRRDLQSQGLGRLFVRQIVKRAEILGAQTLFLEVRPSNLVAINLYQTLGFAEIGRRKDYYPSDSGREDALVMALDLLRHCLAE